MQGLNPSGVRRSFQVVRFRPSFWRTGVSTPPESGGHFNEKKWRLVDPEECLNPSGVRRSFQAPGFYLWRSLEKRVSTPPESGGHFKRKGDTAALMPCLNPSGVRRSFQVFGRKHGYLGVCKSLNPSGVRRSFQAKSLEILTS